jgi:hypothetical protein
MFILKLGNNKAGENKIPSFNTPPNGLFDRGNLEFSCLVSPLGLKWSKYICLVDRFVNK